MTFPAQAIEDDLSGLDRLRNIRADDVDYGCGARGQLGGCINGRDHDVGLAENRSRPTNDPAAHNANQRGASRSQIDIETGIGEMARQLAGIRVEAWHTGGRAIEYEDHRNACDPRQVEQPVPLRPCDLSVGLTQNIRILGDYSHVAAMNPGEMSPHAVAGSHTGHRWLLASCECGDLEVGPWVDEGGYPFLYRHRTNVPKIFGRGWFRSRQTYPS
jgi:hypothetical protein